MTAVMNFFIEKAREGRNVRKSFDWLKYRLTDDGIMDEEEAVMALSSIESFIKRFDTAVELLVIRFIETEFAALYR